MGSWTEKSPATAGLLNGLRGEALVSFELCAIARGAITAIVVAITITVIILASGTMRDIVIHGAQSDGPWVHRGLLWARVGL